LSKGRYDDDLQENFGRYDLELQNWRNRHNSASRHQAGNF
jgi:hypothetical protein